MSTRKLLVAVGLAATLSWQGNLLAQSTQSGSQGQSAQAGQTGTAGKSDAAKANPDRRPTTADKKFVLLAGAGGMLEVELGRLAAEKAASDAVKQFGQRMVDDHSKVNDELKVLADEKGIVLTQQLGETDRAMRDKLAQMSGAEFDRAYMSHMVKDHRMDLTQFQRYARTGGDPEVKAWAGKMLPVLQEHRKLAEQTAAQVGVKAETSHKVQKKH